MKPTATVCPDNNTLAEFVEGHLLAREHEGIFLHIADCSRCRDLCAFAAAEMAKERSGNRVKLSERSRKSILEKITLLRSGIPACRMASWDALFKRIIPLFDQLDHAEVIAAGEQNAVIDFVSDSTDSQKSWRMQLFIPNQLEENLYVAVSIPGSPNVNGRLILCGNVLDIQQGKGVIAYDVLRKSFGNPEVAFVFANGETVAGHPKI